MNTQKLWAVTANHDRTEGRGPEYVVCYATSQGAALDIAGSPLYARNYGIQGCKGNDYNVKEAKIFIYEDVNEFFKAENGAAYTKALVKLSEEDKKALGLI